jgi:hypothetical protein
MAHAALSAWERGEPYEFVEPVVERLDD